MASAAEQIRAALADAARLTGGLSDAQLNWRPAPGSWSINECLDHLTITAELMMARMEEGHEKAKTGNWKPSGEWKPWGLARWFVNSMENPDKMKSKTPATFVPPADRTAKEVVSGFQDIHHQAIARYAEFAKYDINRRNVVSPVSSWLKYSMGTAMAILPAHMRRHIQQALRVRQSPGFPAA